MALNNIKTYALHVAIALDQLVTTIFGGWPDETISSYVWRLEVVGKWAGRILRPTIDWLFSWYESDHCRNAYRAERARTQISPEMR